MVFFQCLPMQIFLNFKIISFSLCLNGYSLLVLSVPFVREMPCFTDKCQLIDGILAPPRHFRHPVTVI